ncbi:MAG: gamma-glutamyltransferase, partial [Gemmatimonadetes bacterium]|nr:gamma-glutamyltransferase [Gemmatimonadota bacterium]
MTYTAARPGDRPSGHVFATRSPAVGRHGMIATSQSLASAAGLKVLQDGGNAIDAAVTAAGVLAVVEPSMNGIGGDLFALVHDGRTGRVHALDASGRAPGAATPEEFARRELREMPADGPLTVNVPGVVSGWQALLTRFGTMTLAQVLQPAIEYAERGFPVTEIIATDWREGEQHKANADFAATFLRDGKAYTTGEIFTNKNLANSLKLIAKGGRD